MISKEMARTINDQINKELYSAYLYQSMAAYSMSAGLKGIANWFQIQVQEEISHAQKFYNYLLEQGEKVVLKTIDSPPSEFDSPLALFEKTLEHERLVTSSINSLTGLSQKENDMATFIFMQWFITEQVEEEANASEIIGKLKLIGDNGSALFMIDKELAGRVFSPAPAVD